jgi:L-threonylcarbamoyladenylate synthase
MRDQTPPPHARPISTRLLTVDPAEPDPAAIARAAEALRAGQLVAFPTETVYGLGADALNPDAVARIFTAKQRPTTDPLIVHAAELSELMPLIHTAPPIVFQLAERFWPGPLTLILPRSERVPNVVTAGQPTVAVRVPSHPVAQALLRAAGVPIAAPSANRFSRPSPTTADHVLADLAGRVDVVLDGGAATIGLESTILDLSGATPVVLRPGGVPLEALRALLPDVALRRLALADDQTAPAPGALIKHYAPESELILFTGPTAAVNARIAHHAQERAARGASVAVLAVGSPPSVPAEVRAISLGDDERAAAERLFAALRELERTADVILVRAPTPTGLGLALWDRLWRAAEGRVVQVDSNA